MNDIIEIITLFIIINRENEIYYNYIRSILLIVGMLSMSDIIDSNIGDKRVKCIGLSIALMSLTSKMINNRYDEINRKIGVE